MDYQKLSKRAKLTTNRDKCKECGKQFVNCDNFDRMRTQKHIIGFALDLYYDGMSLRKIQRHINIYSKSKFHITLYKNG